MITLTTFITFTLPGCLQNENSLKFHSILNILCKFSQLIKCDLYLMSN